MAACTQLKLLREAVQRFQQAVDLDPTYDKALLNAATAAGLYGAMLWAHAQITQMAANRGDLMSIARALTGGRGGGGAGGGGGGGGSGSGGARGGSGHGGTDGDAAAVDVSSPDDPANSIWALECLTFYGVIILLRCPINAIHFMLASHKLIPLTHEIAASVVTLTSCQLQLIVTTVKNIPFNPDSTRRLRIAVPGIVQVL